MARRSSAPIEWTAPMALGYVLERLSRSDISAKQASQLLRRKGCPGELIESTVQSCVERGYIDNKRISEGLTLKAERAGWSNRRLKMTQSQKGVPAGEPIDESASCKQLAERWGARGMLPEKIAQRLRSRGFSFSAIRAALADQSQS